MSFWQFVKAHRPQLYTKKKSWPRFLGLAALYAVVLPVKGAGKLTARMARGMRPGPRMPRVDSRETQALWRDVLELPDIDNDKLADDLTAYIIATLQPPESARDAIHALTASFLRETFSRPPEPPYGDLLLEARWRDQARRFIAAMESEDTIPKLGECILSLLRRFLRDMPKEKGPVFGTVPAKGYADADLVEDMIFEIAWMAPLLPGIRAKLNENATDERHQFTVPRKDKAFSLEKYLKDTALLPLFEMQLPFSIPLKAWGEHAFMAAPSGHGKSMACKAFVKSFRDMEAPPAIFAIDCMGAMHKTITQKYDAVVLDPESAQMNLFKLDAPPSLYFYIFRAIEQKLTGRQATMMLSLIRLLARVPDATLMTLHDICAGIIPVSDFNRYIDGMDEMEQKFFRHEFSGKDQYVNQTKAQIKSRLHTLSMTGDLFRIFSAKENTFNPRALMDEGRLVSVDATGESGIVFGRFVIASIMAAARTRIDIPEHQRKLALLVVDECKDYMDEMTTEILTTARQLGLGMFQATQFLADIPPTIKAATLGNTAVRFAGPVELADPLILSKALRCDVPFITNMTKENYSHSEWACYVRNQTRTAVKLTVPMGVMEKMPNRSEHQKSTVQETPHRTSPPPQNPNPTSSSPHPTTPEKKISAFNDKGRKPEDLDRDSEY